MDAIANGSLGRLFRAYRAHPDHGTAVSQERLAGWLLVTQARVSRIETNRDAVTDLNTLGNWMRTLGVPRELWWFVNPSTAVPSDNRRRMASDAGRESLEFLAWVEDDTVSPAILEHVVSELARVAVDYVHKPLVPVFHDLVDLRDTTIGLLRERPHPKQARELLFIAGTVCTLLAHASQNLGSSAAARSQAATAWACAEQADHDDLRAWVRGTQALIAEWNEKPAQALRLIEEGLRYATSTDSLVRLVSIEARTHARRGDTSNAVSAIERASEARERTDRADDLGIFGGILSFPRSKQLYYAGSALARVGRHAEAERAALDAIAHYEHGPAEQRSYGDEALARMDIALVRAASGDLDGTRDALSDVFAMPAEQRIEQVGAGLRHVRAQLAHPRYQRVTAVRDLVESISAFAASAGQVSLVAKAVGSSHGVAGA